MAVGEDALCGRISGANLPPAYKTELPTAGWMVVSKWLLAYSFCSTLLSAQQWVPYSATYTEIVNETDSSGHTIIHDEKAGEDIRSSDGSKLTTVMVAGQRTKGHLWQGCGQEINIDYSQKKAILGASSPRKHPQLPPDTPEGTMTLGGLEFTAYPVHMSQAGSGTVWVNLQQDIVAKLEIHLPVGNGGQHDSVRQLTSLDLNSTVDDSQMKVPAAFTIEKGKPSAGCVSSTSAR